MIKHPCGCSLTDDNMFTMCKTHWKEIRKDSDLSFLKGQNHSIKDNDGNVVGTCNLRYDED